MKYKYIARHYVPVAGRVYAPGEEIDRPIPEKALMRLLNLVAVECIPDPVYAADMPGDDIADDMPTNDMTCENPDEIEDADVQDEAPIEIDVMDGIIPSDTPEKPKGKKGKA